MTGDRFSRFPLLACAAALGCGRAEPPGATAGAASAAPVFRMAAVEADAPAAIGGQAVFAGEPAAPVAPAGGMLAMQRKIVMSGTLALVTRNFAEAEARVPAIVQRHGGFVAEEQVARQRGAVPSGSWAIRVPAAKFDACLRELAGLASAETQKIATQDVGEEFVDTQARIAARRKVEERLLEMLKDRKGDLKEILELEAKLGTVREELDRAQGRLKFLEDRVALSSIALTLREEKDYVPPPPPGQPGFAERVAEAWHEGVGSLTKVGAEAAIHGARLAPWSPVLLLGGFIAWQWRRRRASKTVSTASTGLGG